MTDPIYQAIPNLTALKKKPFENNVGKEDGGGSQGFLTLSQNKHCFYVSEV